MNWQDDLKKALDLDASYTVTRVAQDHVAIELEDESISVREIETERGGRRGYRITVNLWDSQGGDAGTESIGHVWQLKHAAVLVKAIIKEAEYDAG